MAADKRAAGRGPTFVLPVAEWLVSNMYEGPDDLVGVQLDETYKFHEAGVAEVQVAMLRRAVQRINDSAKAPAQTSECNDDIKELCKVLGKEKKEEKVNVKVGEKLKSACLDQLHADVWPKSSAVDDLATAAAKLSKKGVTKPFVFTEVAKFVPTWMGLDCDESNDEEEDGKQNVVVAELSKALGVGTK